MSKDELLLQVRRLDWALRIESDRRYEAAIAKLRKPGALVSKIEVKTMRMKIRPLLLTLILPACIEITLDPDDYGDDDAGSTTSMTTDAPSDLPQDEPGTETTGDPVGVETETGEPEPECFELGTASLCLEQTTGVCEVMAICVPGWDEFSAADSPAGTICILDSDCGVFVDCPPDGWLVAC